MTQPSAGLQRFPQEDRIDEPGGLQEVTAVLLTCWPLAPPPPERRGIIPRGGERRDEHKMSPSLTFHADGGLVPTAP